MNKNLSKFPIHVPVLLGETLDLLDVQPGNVVVDGTLGFGGHASAMLAAAGDTGALLGIDRDFAALSHCKELFSGRKNVHLFHKTFDAFPECLSEARFSCADRILLDLGMSSYQLDSADRGFSYTGDQPLDMRMNTQTGLTAADVLNQSSAEELEALFQTYGELYQASRFITCILQERVEKRFTTTGQLIACIKKGFFFRNQRHAFIRTCARVFQALRIVVNDELGCLQRFFRILPGHIVVGGRVAILSFHSLEDRMVKQFVRQEKERFRPVNKKPIQLSYHEARGNTRAHSAKLRVFERIA